MAGGSRIKAGVLAMVLMAAAAMPALATSERERARQGTAAYHGIDTALEDGYGQFTDAQGVACIERDGEGAMGIHYVRGAIVGDGEVSAATPEALIYEPAKNGRLRLVGVEYVVFQSDWNAAHSEPPTLFGQEFELVPSGNRYGLPPFYALHAWLWKHNPNGMFADWNPRSSCDHA